MASLILKIWKKAFPDIEPGKSMVAGFILGMTLPVIVIIIVMSLLNREYAWLIWSLTYMIMTVNWIFATRQSSKWFKKYMEAEYGHLERNVNPTNLDLNLDALLARINGPHHVRGEEDLPTE